MPTGISRYLSRPVVEALVVDEQNIGETPSFQQKWFSVEYGDGAAELTEILNTWTNAGCSVYKIFPGIVILEKWEEVPSDEKPQTTGSTNTGETTSRKDY